MENDCPDYDSDDSENWYVDYMDKHPDLDTWDRIAIESSVDTTIKVFLHGPK